MNSQSEDFLQLSVEDDLNLRSPGGGGVTTDESLLVKSTSLDQSEPQEVEDQIEKSVEEEPGVKADENIYSITNAANIEFDPAGANIPPRSSHSFHIDPKIWNDMNCLFQNTRYFLIKSNNFQNVDIAKTHGAWSTTHYNEEKLNMAYKESANVILIFSVNDSGQFQGYARLTSECLYDTDLKVDWILPPHLTSKHLSGVFKLDWITKNSLSFGQSQHLKNAWNEHLPVKIGRDGQEIEPQCGEELCRMFALYDDSTMLDDHARLNLVNEISHELSVIVDKSKKRHAELLLKSGNAEPAKPLAPIVLPSDRSRNQSYNKSSNGSRYNQNGQSQRYNQPGGSYYGHYDGRYTSSIFPNVPKEVILNSTYEEYVAAVTRGYQNFQTNHPYTHDVYQASNSNYDKDVEEFLRKTNTSSSNGGRTETKRSRSRSPRSPSSPTNRRRSSKEKKHKKSRKERHRRSRSNSSDSESGSSYNRRRK